MEKTIRKRIPQLLDIHTMTPPLFSVMLKVVFPSKFYVFHEPHLALNYPENYEV